jgi:hypothetical protein
VAVCIDVVRHLKSQVVSADGDDRVLCASPSDLKRCWSPRRCYDPQPCEQIVCVSVSKCVRIKRFRFLDTFSLTERHKQ